jgi:hypothetical protein
MPGKIGDLAQRRLEWATRLFGSRFLDATIIESMKRDHQVGGPSTYYKALTDDYGAAARANVSRSLFHRLPEKKSLDYWRMAVFLREHPELRDKDHGRIKAALVDAAFCSLDTDVVDLDINWLLTKAFGRKD